MQVITSMPRTRQGNGPEPIRARPGQVLTLDQIRHAAPSVFATSPWHAMSDRYRFVPTSAVVDMFADNGWLPTMAAQSRTRIPGKSDFTRHLVKFQHRDTLATSGDNVPEFLLSNAHDGASAYVGEAGIFRTICFNGLIVKTDDFGAIKLRHSGKDEREFAQQVIDVTYQVIDQVPKTLAQIETFKQITLPAPVREKFAEIAAGPDVRDLPAGINPQTLLTPRRREDVAIAQSLWGTLNIVQENTLQGGQRGRNPETRKKTSARAVKSVTEDLRINRALWAMAETVARHMGA